MTTYALMDPTGQIPILLARAAQAPHGVLILPDSTDLAGMMSQMLTPEGWRPRPMVMTPALKISVDQTVVDCAGLPAQTQVQVLDIAAGELLADVLSSDGEVLLTLDRGIAYRITLTPPLPWLCCEIEIAP